MLQCYLLSPMNTNCTRNDFLHQSKITKTHPTVVFIGGILKTLLKNIMVKIIIMIQMKFVFTFLRTPCRACVMRCIMYALFGLWKVYSLKSYSGSKRWEEKTNGATRYIYILQHDYLIFRRNKTIHLCNSVRLCRQKNGSLQSYRNRGSMSFSRDP